MIDWRTIDYRDWELMIHIYRVLWARESKLSVIQHHLETYHRQCNSIERSGQNSIIELHGQLKMWYAKCLSIRVSQTISINELIEQMEWYAKYDEHWVSFLNQSIIIEGGRIWEVSLPKWYRFNQSSWFWDWFMGAHLYRDWSRCPSLLTIQWYVYQSDRVYIDDIADLWYAFDREIKLLEEYAQRLRDRSWFWQWMVRRHIGQSLKRVQQLRQQVVGNIKQRLCIERQSNEVGRLIHFRGFFQVLTTLYTEEELSQLQEDWRIYQPNYLVSYRRLTQQSLFKDEQKAWCTRHQYVWQQSLHSSQGNLYRYCGLIQWLLSEKILEHHEMVAECYHQTSETYELFWHQLAYYCKQKNHKLYGVLKRLRVAQAYTLDDIQRLWSSNKLAIQYARLSAEGHAWLIRQYDQCSDPRFALLLTNRIASTGHQVMMDMSYYASKKAYVLWYSIAYILNTPKQVQSSYQTEIEQILNSHQFLPEGLVPRLQAHMASLATCIWQIRWSNDVVMQVSSRMMTIGTPVWRRGMQQLNQEINESFRGEYVVKQ